ncbi:MAG: ADP-ribosylglycohydrolase [Deltaproteobacteria bacterium]|nr:MAG: ADP-ribosylglycohydrolase [Deltaproteobacteria bacterium]
MDKTLKDLISLAEVGRLRTSAKALRTLQPPPSAEPPSWDRVEGMLLGLAIGDALGNTTEGRLPHVRRSEYGEIRDYLPNRRAEGRAVGVPSDDTQLAFGILQVLLQGQGLDATGLLNHFAQIPITGIGGTVRSALQQAREGAAWPEAGRPSAGNGALMRVAPVLLPHLSGGSDALWRDAVISTAVTHNDPLAIGCSVAFIDLLNTLLRLDGPPEPTWVLDRWSKVIRPFEPEIAYAPRGAAAVQAPTWRAAQVDVRRALDSGLPTLAAMNRWHSGAYLLETVPCVLLLLARYADDPEEALVRAINDTKDNDTIGAIVGAAMGALYGTSAWPKRWIDQLAGRLTGDDDGAVQAMLVQARERFGAQAR